MEWLQARVASLAAWLAALVLLGLVAAASATAQVSFTRAWGWGVAGDGGQFETCTTTCFQGKEGSGAGQFFEPAGVAVDGSGEVFVADSGNGWVEEFSSAGTFIKAWGWGVADGASKLETCTTTCEAGLQGGGAGELDNPTGVSVDGSGDVFVADYGNYRVDEFSSAGAFIKAWGWGVADGLSRLETCTTTCERGLGGDDAGQLDGATGVAVDGSGDVFVADNAGSASRVDEFSSSGSFIRVIGSGGSGAGQLDYPLDVAVDGSGDVFVADNVNVRVDEFSSAGAFIKAWGWGVADGASKLETCTKACQQGLTGSGAGQFNDIHGVAVDGSGDVFVSEYDNERIDQFSSSGAFIKAWGWGVADGASQFETCTTTCEAGLGGGGAGALQEPNTVAVDGSGNVFVTDWDNYRVDEFAAVPRYTLTVSKEGTGSGTVTSGDGGIDCGGTCSDSYASGTIVTLTATPAAESTFSGWSGAGCSGTGTCTVTMSSDQAVTATFNPSAPPQYTLTVSKAGSGSGTVTSGDGGIDCGGTCSDSYASGTIVTLTASPAAGSTFAGWSGAGCSGTGTCVVTMSTAQNVTATFNPVASLTVEIDTSRAIAWDGHTHIKLTCSGGATGSSCRGTLSLTIRERFVRVTYFHHRRVTYRTIVLASASYTVASGQTQRVALKLTRAALGLLAQAAQRVQATATVGGGRTATRTLTLQRKPRPAHHNKQ